MKKLKSFKSKVVSGSINKIMPHIYAVIVKNDYDRGMLFCRYQEFYESPFPEIRNKEFTLTGEILDASTNTIPVSPI